LLIQIREGKLAGAALVGIRNIPGLSGVELDDDENIHIGPLTTFAQLAADPVIRARIPMLGRAVDQAGGPQLRNVGTIGGNICNGITSADSAPSLFALDALLEFSHIGPSGGIATVVKDIGGFYLGPGKVDLAPDQLLTDICIPKEKYDGFFGCYMKYAMRNAMDIATLGCAVYCRFSGDLSRVEDVRLAYGVANPTPCRCPEAEKTVAGMEAGEEAFRALGRLALGEINPRDSWRASRAFRLQLAEEMAFRCGMACLEEARQTGQAAGGDSRASVSREQALTRPTQGAGRLDEVGQPGQGQAESGAGLPRKDADRMSDAGGKGNTGAGGPLYWLLRCTVNGQAVEIVIDSRESLADLLRNRLGLTSVKKGCDVGECGACTVLVDGKTIDSCIYLARWAEGKHVLTTEGLRGMDNALTPVQQAFIDEAAVQCGFCTPGLIMTATELVDSGRRYTREELRKLISGHICRCTGYQNILDAVEKVVGVECP
jgi:xanthine dehydrogenase FAD-binding subunit